MEKKHRGQFLGIESFTFENKREMQSGTFVLPRRFGKKERTVDTFPIFFQLDQRSTFIDIITKYEK